MTRRFRSDGAARLLCAPLALLCALPAALPAEALERLPPPGSRPDAGLLAQVRTGIPAEVQGWFEAAKAASAKGDSAEALRLQQQVMVWVQANRPALDGFRARALFNLGRYLSERGQPQEALAPTEEAVSILRQLEGSQPETRRFLARALNYLGDRYSNLGRRQEALAATEEAVKIYRELVKTSTTPGFLDALADSLNHLSIKYNNLGRGQEALAATEEAVKIYRELAKTNPAFLKALANSLTNLGIVNSDLGHRNAAMAATEEAVQISRSLPQTNSASPGVLARALNNQSMVLTTLGRRQEALAATEEAVKIRRELANRNPASPADLANSLTKQGTIYSKMSRGQEALAATEEAVKINRELAKTNPALLGNLAQALYNLGNEYRELGRQQEALAPTAEAVKIVRERAKVTPAAQANLARYATHLAKLQLQLANPSAALPLLKEAVRTDVTYLQAQLPLLPEARRLALVETLGIRWQIPFSLAQEGDQGAALALFTRLNRQGLLQDIQRSQVLLARSGPHRELFEQLTLVTTQLANTTLKPEQEAPLLVRKEQLEQALYRQLPQIQPRLVEPQQIARLLSPGSALVEFQRYRFLNASTRQFGPPRYLALLLRPDGTIRAIGLGEAAPIDAAVAEAVAASADPNRQAQAPQKLAAVSRLVLAPLQRELAGVRELFVSPDGELHRLPFAALPVAAADGQTLGDAMALRLLTTGRDLLRLQQPARASGPAVLIANPDFNAARPATGASSAAGPGFTQSPNSAAAGQLRGGQQRTPGGLGPTRWPLLAGTEQEARQLVPLLGGSAVISGPAATASVVLAQRAPRILHIATHGFFLTDPPPTSDSAAPEAAPSATPAGEDPLQRSGLVFAGANRPAANPSDDGYLTAAEATAMDLDGTELVTLSACETALGAMRRGEGVYGLQRSLAVAGARSTLLSLWKVDDGHTITFMEHFYSRLKAGEGRADALRHTQSEFRNNKISTYNDIRVWGAFQLSGEWRALPGW